MPLGLNFTLKSALRYTTTGTYQLMLEDKEVPLDCDISFTESSQRVRCM
jgi:hypothetical protein